MITPISHLEHLFFPPTTFPLQAGGLCSKGSAFWDPGTIYEDHCWSFSAGKRDHCGGHAGSKSICLEVTQVPCIRVISQIDSCGQLWQEWGKETQISPRKEQQIFGKLNTVYGNRYHFSQLWDIFLVGKWGGKKPSEKLRSIEGKKRNVCKEFSHRLS